MTSFSENKKKCLPENSPLAIWNRLNCDISRHWTYVDLNLDETNKGLGIQSMRFNYSTFYPQSGVNVLVTGSSTTTLATSSAVTWKIGLMLWYGIAYIYFLPIFLNCYLYFLSIILIDKIFILNWASLLAILLCSFKIKTFGWNNPV